MHFLIGIFFCCWETSQPAIVAHQAWGPAMQYEYAPFSASDMEKARDMEPWMVRLDLRDITVSVCERTKPILVDIC